MSIHHVLGFDRIELWHDNDTDCVLRLHLWPERPEPAAIDDIHNHGRHLAILMLCGEYVNEVCAIREGRGDLLHYRYSKDDETLDTRMDFVGNARLLGKTCVSSSSGQMYELSPTVRHRIQPITGLFTASLVLQGPLVRRTSDVYTTRIVAETRPKQPDRIRRIEVIDGLDDLCRVLSGSP